jgi:signal transduction histidine kinase/PAS domain-containing protein
MSTKIRLVVLVLTAFSWLILLGYSTTRVAGFPQNISTKPDTPAVAQNGDPSMGEPLILTDEQGKYPLGLYLEILEDPSAKLSIEDVSSQAFNLRFTPSKVAVPNYGYTDSAYWVRIRLDNETQQTDEWLLELGFPQMHYVDLYTPMQDEGGFEVKQTGILRPISTRDVLYPDIVFNLSVPTHSQHTFYLRFQNSASMTLPLTLWTEGAFFSESGQVQMLHWLFFGGILALLVYHLFLLITLKEAVYLYFVVLLASLLIMVFDYTGYMGVYFSPDWFTFKLYYFPLSLALLFACIILFSDAFLGLKTRHPKLHRANIILLAVWGVLVLLIPFISYLNLARLVVPWGLVSMSVTWVIGIVAWRKGFQPVLLFMLAWLGMSASFILVLLVRLGIASSTGFNENLYLVGFMVMAVCWSLALAERINLLKANAESASLNLQKSEYRLSQILEGMPLGVVVYGKDQKPRYLNQRTIEILSNPTKGIRPDLAAGRDLSQAIEHFSFEVTETGEKYPLEDLPVFYALNGKPASVDNIVANLGGRRIPLEIWAAPVRDEAGNVESAIAVLQDITQRKQVEAELDEYRKKLESLAEKRTAQLNAVNKELRQRLEWFAAINFISQTVAQSTDFTKMYEKILEIIKNLFSTQDSFIAELDENRKQLKILAHTCHSDIHPDMTDSFTTLPEGILPGLNLEQGGLFSASGDQLNTMDGPIKMHIRNSKVQSILFKPLILREQVYGFLGLEMSEVNRTITDEETNLLNIFSIDIAQLIESARLFEKTKLMIAQDERDRLARELHDSVTQALFSATLVAEVLPQIWRRDPERAMQSLEKLQRLTRGALAEMRTVLLELRPSAVTKTPLGEILAQLTEAVTSRSGLPFQLFIEKIPLLPEEVQLSFYRIAQEALNNVVKHAQARQVTVSLNETQREPDTNCPSGCEVRLVILDDGVGFASESAHTTGHLGIGIMRERASSIGAVLSIESQPGHGTQVSLIWCNKSKSDRKDE